MQVVTSDSNPTLPKQRHFYLVAETDEEDHILDMIMGGQPFDDASDHRAVEFLMPPETTVEDIVNAFDMT